LDEVIFLSYLMAVVLGLVQGVAEFLPISSSGHLTLLQHFFGVEEVDNLFNILLHFATLIAVCAVYWKDIVDMIVEFFRGLASLVAGRGGRETESVPPARRLVLLVILGTLPLFLVLPLDDKVEALGNSPVFVACMLLVTGFILFFSDRMAKGRKTERTATVKDALLVGLAQGVATIPGLSRSGCTISAGMALGFDRKFAVRYSFLLSLPAVLGATLLKVVHAVGDETMDLTLLPKYIVGMVVAGVVGYFSIQLVNLLAQKNKFGRFAYYCWCAGLVALIASFLVK
jgi:undecaprenyl-diphosphatase